MNRVSPRPLFDSKHCSRKALTAQPGWATAACSVLLSSVGPHSMGNAPCATSSRVHSLHGSSSSKLTVSSLGWNRLFPFSDDLRPEEGWGAMDSQDTLASSQLPGFVPGFLDGTV